MAPRWHKLRLRKVHMHILHIRLILGSCYIRRHIRSSGLNKKSNGRTRPILVTTYRGTFRTQYSSVRTLWGGLSAEHDFCLPQLSQLSGSEHLRSQLRQQKSTSELPPILSPILSDSQAEVGLSQHGAKICQGTELRNSGQTRRRGPRNPGSKCLQRRSHSILITAPCVLSARSPRALRALSTCSTVTGSATPGRVPNGPSALQAQRRRRVSIHEQNSVSGLIGPL